MDGIELYAEEVDMTLNALHELAFEFGEERDHARIEWIEQRYKEPLYNSDNESLAEYKESILEANEEARDLIRALVPDEEMMAAYTERGKKKHEAAEYAAWDGTCEIVAVIGPLERDPSPSYPSTP